jgi:hypothetical protein
MGKHHQRPNKKGSEQKSNHPAKPQTSKTTQNEQPKQAPLKKEGEPTTENGALKPSKVNDEQRGRMRFSWWGFFSFIFSLILAVIGYDFLWPKIVIDYSQAVAFGLTSSQFTFSNQPRYPVEISHVDVIPIGFSANVTNQLKVVVKDMTIRQNYNGDQIGGKDSITVEVDSFLHFANIPTVNEGSKIIVRITYKLPVLKIQKTDSALFERARDSTGNGIWIKKPLGKLAYYKTESIWLVGPGH